MGIDLKKLSEPELRAETKKRADAEKHEMALLIEHLIEVSRRGLYLKWGYGSLFQYVVDELKYEPGAASYRIAAVKASQSIPNLPSKIESGEISLKAIQKVESFAFHEGRYRGKKLTHTEKKEIYSQISNLTSKHVESKLADIATSPKYTAPVKEVERVVKGQCKRIEFTETEEDSEFIQMAKEVLSHTCPGISTAEVYKFAVRELVRKRHPRLKAERAKKREEKNASKATKEQASGTKMETQKMDRGTDSTQPVAHLLRSTFTKRTRYIPAKESHKLWLDYDGKGCAYIDKATGKRCGSKHKLQKDHIHAFAYGGENKRRNLQLFCANHNLYKAQLEFGHTNWEK